MLLRMRQRQFLHAFAFRFNFQTANAPPFFFPSPCKGEGGRLSEAKSVGGGFVRTIFAKCHPTPARCARRPSPFRGGIKCASVIARIVGGAGYAVVCSLAPRLMPRGWSAERRTSPKSAASSCENAGAFRRSIAAFLSPGPCFRMRTGGLPPSLSGQLSPPFIRAASSH